MPKIFHLVINPKSLEFYEDIKEYVTGLKYFQYMKVVEHIGQDEKHFHMFLQLSRDLPKLSVNKLYGAHIKPKMFGSTKKIIDYIDCKDEKHIKEGVTAVLIDEIGEYKQQGGYSVKSLSEINDKYDLPDYKMYNIWKQIKFDDNVDIDIDDWGKNVKVYWIQGESGIGKTNRAKQIVKDNKEIYGTKFNRVKYENGFWTGVGYAKIAIYDDFRDGHMKPSEFINFIDYNKHYMNIKGGSVLNNYELIIITTVQKLERIYGNVDGEPRLQWTRRIEIIDMYNKNDNLSLITNQSRDYERDDECYYCDNKILCNCKCIENNRTCIEQQCNCNVMKCDFFNKD